MKYYHLNNGKKMPTFGTGTNTYGKENRDFHGKITMDTKELQSAIQLGYRLIDTAIMYRNEAVIGKAVRESGLDRSAFFIVSKIPREKDYTDTDDLVRHFVNQSLNQLNIEYIDLYLIHFPLEADEENLRVWRVLESFVHKGLIHSIGVSNFNETQLQYVMKHANIKPVLNQFQSYPGRHQQALIDFCKENGVIPEAYHSLAKVSEDNKKMLEFIGSKYQKTWSQVVLNYQVGEGLVVIPKSHQHLNQKNNIDIFDFELSNEDAKIIKDM